MTAWRTGGLVSAELQSRNRRRPRCAAWFVEYINYNTAAVASVEDVANCMARADAQLRKVLGVVMA